MGANDKHAAAFHPYGAPQPAATGPEVHYDVPAAAEPENTDEARRRTALDFAIRAIEGRNFSWPGKSAVSIAQEFETYLRDGTTEEG